MTKQTTSNTPETYTLSRLAFPDGKYKPSYIATLHGKQFLVGQFDTVEEARAAADAFLPGWLTQLKPAYRVEKIGTVSVDVGTIVIVDPCRTGQLDAMHDNRNMLDSPLMPDGISFKMDGSDKAGMMLGEGGLAKQIVIPATPDKCDKPTKIEDCGTSSGNALSLSTGFGDGEYEVFAEIIDFGGIVGERIAAIHMQFLASEDIAKAKKLAKSGKRFPAAEEAGK